MLWLIRSGMNIELDKTEVMFFERLFERNLVPMPGHLLLPRGPGMPDFMVRPSETIRYLGFFIYRRLNWAPHVNIMCNRAHTSIRALSLLGNSIHRLSMANWRLVLNAVCLPVMTYGCQLWYRENGKGVKKLIVQLQLVQNKMVKVVAGAFRTAPHKALLEITRMLPMQFHLAKLTHTSALCLYRLPQASQLLCCLGPSWHVPGQGDHQLVVPVHPGMPGCPNLRPTALEALAAWVPSEGPCIDVTALTPWDVPNWRLRVRLLGTCPPHTQKTWVQSLWDHLPGSSNRIVHAMGVVRQDSLIGTTAGGAAATLSDGGGGTCLSWPGVMSQRLVLLDLSVFRYLVFEDSLPSSAS
jgi:hypothetical protein